MGTYESRCREACAHKNNCMPERFDTSDCIAAWKASGLTPTEVVGLKVEVKELRALLEAAVSDIRELLFDDGLSKCECCVHIEKCDPNYDCSEDAPIQPNQFSWEWCGQSAKSGGTVSQTTSRPPDNYIGEAAVEFGAPFDEPIGGGEDEQGGYTVSRYGDAPACLQPPSP